MSGNIVILADDLSGAADCAVACAGAKPAVVVSLDGMTEPPDDGVFSIDLDTRRMSADEAGRCVSAFMAGHAAEDAILFKKLDSTWRGHMAVELTAMLRAGAGTKKTVAIFAPAYPALGRTMRDGKCFLHGAPLESSEIWRHEALTGCADIRQVLRESRLRVAVMALPEVRGGRLAALFRERAAFCDVLACDSEHDSDLDLIAGAAKDFADTADLRVVWAGSGGLAHALGRVLLADRPPAGPAETALRNPGGLLFVSGSFSTISRRQMDLLAERCAVKRIEISTAEEADDFAAEAAALQAALAQGQDVALSIAAGETVSLDRSAQLTRRLARLAAPHASSIGGLVVTGGETARAVLTAMKIKSLRLIKEIGSGVPLAVSHDDQKLPVITKAGAFGEETVFVKCHAALSGLPMRQQTGERP